MVPNETISWQEALGVVEKLSWLDQARLVLELLQRQAAEAEIFNTPFGVHFGNVPVLLN
jgi:hypothetical protein